MRKPRRVVRSNEQRAAVKEEHGDTGGFQQRGDKYERGSTGAKERGEEYSAAPRAIVFRGCKSSRRTMPRVSTCEKKKKGVRSEHGHTVCSCRPWRRSEHRDGAHCTCWRVHCFLPRHEHNAASGRPFAAPFLPGHGHVSGTV